MFSLIITIVSIALVVALVAATMYHNGDTVSQGRAAATAATYISGMQQVQAAYRASQALNGVDAASIQDLINQGTLKSVPKDFNTNFGQMFSVVAGNYTFMSTGPTTFDVCQQIEKTAGRTVSAVTDLPRGASTNSYGCARQGLQQVYFFAKL